MRTASVIVPALVALAFSSGLSAQDRYQTAPPEVRRVLEAARPPMFWASPTGTHAFLGDPRRNPPIRELARPMLRLAGLRLDPTTYAPHGGTALTRLELMDLATGKTQALAVPARGRVGLPQWSPDGRHFSLVVTTDKAAELWIGTTATGALRRVPGLRLNAVLGGAVTWMPGSTALLVRTVPANHGPLPAAPEAPAGPRIQEHNPTQGKGAPVRTYQDLLQNAHDEALFAHMATGQLQMLDLGTLKARPLGRPGMIEDFQPSPDGKHLLVSLRHKPFSYLVPADDFPVRWAVWDLQGREQKPVADLPRVEGLPIGGVSTGPRSLAWHPLEPATLRWIEALDGGDPKAKVPHRDRLMLWPAPFSAKAQEALRTEHRLAGVMWTETGRLLVREYDRARNWTRAWLHGGAAEPRLLWDLSVNDRYRNPGNPVGRILPNGAYVLREDQGHLLLTGSGATPQGDRPFLNRFSLATGTSEPLFRCGEGVYESVSEVLAPNRFITRRESPSEPPNYFMKGPGQAERALTRFQDPVPELRKIQKKLVRYKRPDGVDLSFTLYLPPDHQEGQRHPALVWAYPMEFTDASTAGQVSGSESRFTFLGGTSHLFMALKGYAVLDNATMPVVGNPETVNNTFLDQVVASAKAAIDKAAELGVVDPDRVAVGGHSYGAFMTANLLAHSDLFKCGIARSGAYNRTLTPFGFQSERRTLWEAPDMYLKVSPFMKAHAFKAPILLIHGEADNNSGTFPIQSERLFQALKGNNQAVRYVTLPHESHGYSAQESVEHVLWEMGAWLDRNLKK